MWHFLYSVVPHPVSSLHIYTFVVSRAFMAGAASQAGDADSSRAPGLTSGLQGSVNVHRGALLLVPQWQCISSVVFYSINRSSKWAMKRRCSCSMTLYLKVNGKSARKCTPAGKCTHVGMFFKNVHSTREKREILPCRNKEWRQPNIGKTSNDAKIITLKLSPSRGPVQPALHGKGILQEQEPYEMSMALGARP